jgi:hypothetical protein
MIDPDSKYTIVRHDRPLIKGGGVCILFKKTFSIIEVQTVAVASGIEMLCVDFLGAIAPFWLFVVYRPPLSCLYRQNESSPADSMAHLVSNLELNINKAGPTIILGDFNCPDIDWQSKGPF